jgi:hypothetical protein
MIFGETKLIGDFGNGEWEAVISAHDLVNPLKTRT